MKKKIINHLIFWFGYFIFLTIVNNLYSFEYWPLYVGGVVGFFMSNLDHLLHVFVLQPQELTSVRVRTLISYKQYKEAIKLLFDTKEERPDLIFHTALFQIIFVILTFWVISSSGSLFARGLVLSYLLSLSLYDYQIFQEKSKNLFFGIVLALFIFGFLL